MNQTQMSNIRLLVTT